MEEGGWSSGASSEAGDFFSEAVPRNFYDLRTMLKNTQHKSRTLGRRTIITFFAAQEKIFHKCLHHRIASRYELGAYESVK